MDLTFAGVALSTERGNELVEFQGRLYRNEHMSRAPYRSSDGATLTYYFVCHHNGCSSRIKKIQPCDPMSGEPTGDPTFVEKNDTHVFDCVANQAEIFRAKGQRVVEDLVLSGHKSIPHAIGEVQSFLRREIGDDEASLFGNTLQLKRQINSRIADKNGHSPSTSATLNSIPNDLTITRNGEPYLLVFEDYVDEHGAIDGVIIVFATTSDLVELLKAEVIVVDGTFKIKPKPYDKVRGGQVFTVNTFIGIYPKRRMERRLLGLLPKKSEHCYWTFWKLSFQAAAQFRGLDLSRPRDNINWKEIMCDFEVGIPNGFFNFAYNVLGLSVILLACCHMHYCSSIIKKVKKIGLGPAYTNDAGLKEFIALLFALAFLPACLIPSVYVYIRDVKILPALRDQPDVQRFITYYEATYIANPVYPVHVWSVFDRNDHSKRTTNDLEGKHR